MAYNEDMKINNFEYRFLFILKLSKYIPIIRGQQTDFLSIPDITLCQGTKNHQWALIELDTQCFKSFIDR